MSQGPMRYSPINQTRSAMRKKRLNNQKNVLVLIVTALIIFTLFFTVLLISLSVASAKHRNDLNNPDSSESGNASISESGSESIPGSESGSDSPIGDFTYKLKDFSESSMHLGPLVIINDENEYTFADEKVFSEYANAVSKILRELRSMRSGPGKCICAMTRSMRLMRL